ncbi:glycosyl transferase family 90 [Porphyromonas sp.]|uniref:glycosyl transferase family 90 n=1 Tax=Porphyromonas sp. TaxID=1924944 RepID=UPI0026DC5030|nr:glycosyl transferase family 90 [Porphyromonas sp.]MDO4770860.1 glycosyl transferase family 90 [Porphyromonas sp.]
MKLRQRLSYIFNSGKNPKFVYYIQNYFRLYLQPKVCFRKRLRSRLARLEKRSDKEYIMERVNYYNALGTTPLPADTPRLRDHGIEENKVYFFDTYEYTRYFDDDLRWMLLPGDIVHVPDHPTIVKSRPLTEDNANSVLMKLDKVRHFTFIKDHKPFKDKMNKVIFRGKTEDKEPRIRFMEMYFGHPMCDLGDVSRSCPRQEWIVEKMTLRAHLDYKFIMALEGNDVASNLKWVMSSNSLAVMPRPTCETWFMEGKLIPNHHYVEIKPDFSDLEERVNYYIAHTDEAQRIIDNANEYVKQFWDKEREELISLLVLQKYFEKTNPGYKLK